MEDIRFSLKLFKQFERFQLGQILTITIPLKNQFVKKSVMLRAHLTCVKQINNLPRQIEKKDKTVKFDKKYSGLFRKNKNYKKVFVYNLYLE